ncbi:MAG TPA: radical SAM family heme chaperone HemW [Pyrinomonadaceae bacterium]|jgi:oxygen-independent coproporphyrinogen-3 oxidase|nr:radical SAM family heme chaperone HemW [Pyrinomonadaceae bacterium]
MKRAGIYIHVPFCRSRCSYCDFATGAYEGQLAERYVSALTTEISTFNFPPDAALHDATNGNVRANWPRVDDVRANAPRADVVSDVDTIYFGGGTPSLLTAAQVERILRAVGERFRVAPDAEVTLEMNPGTVTLESVEKFRACGVNRASFGLQTFDDEQLRRLGRTHTADDARRTLAVLREAGFDNVSFDLIAGLPGQTLAEWARNMDDALALRPAHLSLYLLEVHEGTPLAEQLRQGRWPQPDADVAAEMYQLLIERTRAAGYEHYEISNFCLPGREARHNLKYWTNAPYYGFGSSAHSYDGARLRWSNERDAARYVELLETRGAAVVETNELSVRDAGAEALFLGLRLMRGVDLSEHRARFGTDVRSEYAADLSRFQAAELIRIDGDLLRLTRSGVLLSNEVFAAFV